MCGIAGIISKDFYNNDKAGINLLHKMTDALSHRGPDHRGFIIEKVSQNIIALGHRRLSIIDLNQSSNQPMTYDNLIMIFNGEIYNYIEIRRELESKGYIFKSGGDTEVLIKAFHFWGIESFSIPTISDYCHRFNSIVLFNRIDYFLPFYHFSKYSMFTI